MTKDEALNKIKELEDFIKELDNKVGFEDDTLFLLSIDEYEKYKNVIPKWNSLWWLRSPGDNSDYAAAVSRNGRVFDHSTCVDYNYGSVRPVLKWGNDGYVFIHGVRYDKVPVGTRILYKSFPFICIDEDKRLFIAEVPIATHRFDKSSNDYAISEVRQFLKDWQKER